jgi:hypothetical protein
MSATWTPISSEELKKEIDSGITKISSRARALWSILRVTPQKWVLSPWGDEGGGFWVVATGGENCIYYNDIEDGFNVSRYTQHGIIADYFCSHDELQWVVHRMMKAIDAG